MKFYSRMEGVSKAFVRGDFQQTFLAPDWMETTPVVILRAIMDYTATNQKIQLIKMLRNLHGKVLLGLKEAKDAVESVPTKYPAPYTANDVIPMVKVFVKWVPELEEATQEIPELKAAFAKSIADKKADRILSDAKAYKEALEQEKLKQQEIKAAAERQRKMVLDGMTCAYDNARILGYQNSYEAMRDVLVRLENGLENA